MMVDTSNVHGTRLLVLGGWVFGAFGCVGVPLACALLSARVLGDREYLALVAGSLATYLLGLWAAERGGSGEH